MLFYDLPRTPCLLSVPKIRFYNNGNEVRRGPVPLSHTQQDKEYTDSVSLSNRLDDTIAHVYGFYVYLRTLNSLEKNSRLVVLNNGIQDVTVLRP